MIKIDKIIVQESKSVKNYLYYIIINNYCSLERVKEDPTLLNGLGRCAIVTNQVENHLHS